jgi:CDP-glycerol glycerophosphotransferase (TagB/SpsB family)
MINTIYFFGKKLIKKPHYILFGFISNFIFLICSFFPRQKNLWILSAWSGLKFSDNPKYIYLQLSSDKLIEAVWISKSKSLVIEMKQSGLNAIYAYSLRGIFAQTKAGVAIYTHSVESEFIPFLISRSVIRVQTWHGMPIKKIGYDAIDSSTKYFFKMLSFFFPYKLDNHDLIIAGSNLDKKIYERVFNIKSQNVVVTGYPRNDQLIPKKRHKKRNKKIKVIYMPTFRGLPGSEFPLFKSSGFNFQEADSFFKKHLINFYIKLHPVQKISDSDLAQILMSKNIHYLDNSDAYEILYNFDILVTDFSGIYFDYLLTGNPIIMAPIELKNYLKNDRRLYYSYKSVCIGEPCYTWNSLFFSIQRAANNIQNGYTPEGRYKYLRSKFHQYFDSFSSERVINEIKKRAGV